MRLYFYLSPDEFLIKSISDQKIIFTSKYQRDLDTILIQSLDCLESLPMNEIIFYDNSNSFTSTRMFATFLNALVFARGLQLLQIVNSGEINNKEPQKIIFYDPEYDRIAPIQFHSNFKLREKS